MVLTDSELDQLVIRNASDSWQKLAMIVAKSTQGLDIGYEDRVFDRILVLVEAGVLESTGDVCEPRNSEIRLHVGSQ